jgi:hypothetical protein
LEQIEDRHVPEEGHPHGKPASWALVAVTTAAFITQLRARSTVDLMTAASASGLGRTKAYEGDAAYLVDDVSFSCKLPV